MSLLVTPNIFANGTGPANIIDAVQMNANFTAVATAVNNIYPSQIIPTTTGQATFGGNQPYLFLASLAAVTPLTVTSASAASANTLVVNMGATQSVAGLLVNGAASITGNILEVDLTAGGTKGLQFTAAGALNIGANGAATVAGDGGFARGVSSGAIVLGGGTDDGSIDFGVSTASVFTLLRKGATAVNLALGTASNGGSLSIGNGSSLSALEPVNTSVNTVQGLLFGFLTGGSGGSLECTMNTNGDLGINGALHQTSRRAAKKNIADLSFSPLDVVMETNWRQYQLLHEDEEKQPHVGFIADESSEWLAGKTKDYMVPSDLAAIGAASVKDLTLRLRALGIAV